MSSPMVESNSMLSQSTLGKHRVDAHVESPTRNTKRTKKTNEHEICMQQAQPDAAFINFEQHQVLQQQQQEFLQQHQNATSASMMMTDNNISAPANFNGNTFTPPLTSTTNSPSATMPGSPIDDDDDPDLYDCTSVGNSRSFNVCTYRYLDDNQGSAPDDASFWLTNEGGWRL